MVADGDASAAVAVASASVATPVPRRLPARAWAVVAVTVAVAALGLVLDGRLGLLVRSPTTTARTRTRTSSSPASGGATSFRTRSPTGLPGDDRSSSEPSDDDDLPRPANRTHPSSSHGGKADEPEEETEPSDKNQIEHDAPPRSPPPPATIVCQLSGEMGNNLGKYAHCHVVSELLRERFRLETEIVLRHQDHPKWRSGARDLQQCFPLFRGLNFAGGNTADFDRKRAEQVALLGKNLSDVVLAHLDSSTGHVPLNETDDALRTFARLVKASRRGDPPFVNVTAADEVLSQNDTDSSSTSAAPVIRVPFLFVAWMSSIDPYVDSFMDDFRQLFALDSNLAPSSSLSTKRTAQPPTGPDACCGALPDPDETVFHLRNFFVEMPRAGPRLGFNEATPRQVSDVLLGHLKGGDKVAILSRFPQESAQPYVDALEGRGLQVRFVSGQSGVQDFCFLVHARREMVGVALSTYFLWAAYLSNCTKVVAYSIDSINRRRHFGDAYLHHKFRHPTLRDRMSLPLLPHELDPWPKAAPGETSNRTTNATRRRRWRRR